MPKSQERKRGGVVRYRTIGVGRGKYIRIAIVRKAGRRGGHTIAGPVHRVKNKKGWGYGQYSRGPSFGLGSIPDGKGFGIPKGL